MPELIDKQKALDIAMSYCPDDDGCCSKAGNDLREMLDEIEALPIVHIDDMAFNIQNEIQAEKPSRTAEITFVRHGRWIEVTKHRDENGTILTDYECSECFAMVKDSDAEEIESERFCYNCGTKMRATDTNVGSKGGADNGNG